MKKIIILMCLLCCGCDWIYDSKPLPKQGDVKLETQSQRKATVETEMLLDMVPVPVPPLKEVEFDIMGEKIKVPANTKVNIKSTSKAKQQENELYSLIGKLNPKNGSGQLIWVGALCIAGGAVVCYFGIWKVGIGLMIFGFMLIACAITMEQYPWVFLLIMLAGLVGIGLFIYYIIKTKSITGAKDEMELTLSAICNKIDVLKKINPDLVKQFITDELTKHDASATIAKVTRSVRNA